ncbi:hypothetical protein Taro_049346, partial [Colocasia esculenta]|nr:hypothetical protein [Colocasia esculenta]
LWRLATVTQVEETKLVVAVVPIWLGTIAFGLSVAQTSTFFIKQAVLMDRKLGKHFVIPLASIYSLAAFGMLISVCIYDKLLVPFLRRKMGNERGISILRRIDIGMAFSVIAMVVAAVVEKERRDKATSSIAGSTPMNVFGLVPQFMILGFADGFALVGLQEYFYDQVPDSMRSLGIGFYLSVIGAANFLSSLLITVVDKRVAGAGSSSGDEDDLEKK